MDETHREHTYVLSFNTNAQRRTALRVIRAHNDRRANPHKYPAHYVRNNVHEAYERAAPGEELWALDLVTFKKGWRQGPHATPSGGPSLARGLIFSNTGDNAQKNRTFHFLNWHLMRAMPGVYHDSFPAVAVYVCDDAVMNSIEARVALNDECVVCAPEPKPEDPLELVQPAYWITRKLEGNYAYRELMVETRGNEERRKRSRDHKDQVVPYLSQYETVQDGWFVSGEGGHGERFDKDSRERAEEYARFVHATWDDGTEDEAAEAAEAAERVDWARQRPAAASSGQQRLGAVGAACHPRPLLVH